MEIVNQWWFGFILMGLYFLIAGIIFGIMKGLKKGDTDTTFITILWPLLLAFSPFILSFVVMAILVEKLVSRINT